MLSLVSNDDKKNNNEEKVLYSVLIESLRQDAQSEEEEYSPADMDWKSVMSDTQEIIAQSNDKKAPGSTRATNNSNKSQQPLTIGRHYIIHKEVKVKVKVKGNLRLPTKRCLEEVHGRLALVGHTEEATSRSKWRRQRYKLKAKTYQTESTTIRDPDGSMPQP